MASTPRWWRISFWISIWLLAICVSAFVWALSSELLGLPSGTEDEEWFKLGAAIVSALSGLLLLVVLAVLFIIRWLRRTPRSG